MDLCEFKDSLGHIMSSNPARPCSCRLQRCLPVKRNCSSSRRLEFPPQHPLRQLIATYISSSRGPGSFFCVIMYDDGSWCFKCHCRYVVTIPACCVPAWSGNKLTGTMAAHGCIHWTPTMAKTKAGGRGLSIQGGCSRALCGKPQSIKFLVS